MTTKITIKSGSKADNHVLYAQGPLDSLPLTANVDGIEVEVSVSHSEPNALKVTLDYNEDATWEQYTTGEDIFEPVKIDDLPAEIHEIIKIGVEEDRSINEYSGDVESYTVIDDFEKGKSQTVPEGEKNSRSEGEIESLNALLGKRLVAYSHGDDETMLKFEDGSILQWYGVYNLPLDADEEGLKDIWEERASWVGNE